MKVGLIGRMRRGTPSWDLQKLLNPHGVEFIEFEEGKSYDAVLAIDAFKKSKVSGYRSVLYCGSILHVNKSDHKNRFAKALVLSDYFLNLLREDLDASKTEVVHMVGGLPCDLDMNPILSPRTISDSIQVVAIAKWWKRPFKRLDQTVKFFNEYFLKAYPGSTLHILGVFIPEVKSEGNVVYHPKGHQDISYIDIFKNAHLQLVLTPFDTGPKTLCESLHYRVPFLSSRNCAGPEFIQMLGKCGSSIDIDPYLDSREKYGKLKPMNDPKYYTKELDYEKILCAAKEIVDNFEEYTSWEWSETLNYERQAQKWIDALSGG